MSTIVKNPPSHLRQVDEAAAKRIRDAYVAAGAKNGPVCASVTCLLIARRKVFWPVRPGEEFPLYCGPCAAWAKQVMETLGVKYADEPLPWNDSSPDRLIDLED